MSETSELPLIYLELHFLILFCEPTTGENAIETRKTGGQMRCRNQHACSNSRTPLSALMKGGYQVALVYVFISL